MSECLSGWCADEDWCAVTCTAELLGRKWHPAVVHRLLTDGPQGFAALADAIPGISNTVLSDALERLEAEDVVAREVVSERPFRVEYRLTDRGASLEPVVKAMATWGREHARRDAAD